MSLLEQDKKEINSNESKKKLILTQEQKEKIEKKRLEALSRLQKTLLKKNNDSNKRCFNETIDDSSNLKINGNTNSNKNLNRTIKDFYSTNTQPSFKRFKTETDNSINENINNSQITLTHNNNNDDNNNNKMNDNMNKWKQSNIDDIYSNIHTNKPCNDLNSTNKDNNDTNQVLWNPPTIEDVFSQLSKSKFRSKFKLGTKEHDIVQKKRDLLKNHAFEIIKSRLGDANPKNDGKQTPMRGHPVFIAQHATGTCCRSCLRKWHGIQKGIALNNNHLTHIVNVIEHWINLKSKNI